MPYDCFFRKRANVNHSLTRARFVAQPSNGSGVRNRVSDREDCVPRPILHGLLRIVTLNALEYGNRSGIAENAQCPRCSDA
jgi:hypothetical protein